ncbi:MAG TPA: cation:proton antiporter subunit C [Candidatus Onthenecus intestinigallinarum]|uniref:Cation:proton antiporter subunit C n=1 Tax=Candidatus Onthenecus intestinigallinarum TaxID=2840875 RepID=A0A9D0Z9A3_9FIRM|nr:cation:proton antiporter subunit C [Candidatus Onthenecus intestinigallinarum]
MFANLLTNYEEAAAIILFGIGFTTLLLQRNMIKKIIGFSMMDSAIYLFLAAKGYIEGRGAPIVVNGVQSVEAYINPIPSGLVLTGIVVSVSVSALMLALTVRLYRRYHSLDIDEIATMVRKEEP